MIRLILADDQGVFRAGLIKLLSMEDDLRIVAQCADIECLQTALATFREATIIFSSSLTQDPVPLMQQICSLGDRGFAVLENGEAPEAYVAAHVHGICFRGVSGRSLVESVRRVSRGERVLQSRSGTSYTVEFDEDLVGARVRDRLTAKELKVKSLIMQGCKDKEIAWRLGTSQQGIEGDTIAGITNAGWPNCSSTYAATPTCSTCQMLETVGPKLLSFRIRPEARRLVEVGDSQLVKAGIDGACARQDAFTTR